MKRVADALANGVKHVADPATFRCESKWFEAAIVVRDAYNERNKGGAP